jgi:phosphatidate cytidylyltransferase
MNARYLTAAVGIPIVLGLVWLGGTPFVVVVAILALLAMRELELVCRRAKTPIAAIVAYPALLFILAVTWQFAREGERLHADAVWIWLVPMAMLAAGVLLFGTRQKISLVSIALTQLAVVYVGLFAFLILLRLFPSGGLHLFWVVILGVWTSDSAAYFAGRKFGTLSLTPLSPGKTREGLAAGVLASIVLCGALAMYFGFAFYHAIALGVLVALSAPMGDLIESFWKRELNAKDMGAILPGHGGVLDRCDSLLLACFVVYLYALRFL